MLQREQVLQCRYRFARPVYRCTAVEAGALAAIARGVPAVSGAGSRATVELATGQYSHL